MGDQANSSGRLDAFVDSAFAFAVTLLVIGGGGVPSSYSGLEQAVRNAPAFAIGFAFIAMFWHGHVRWRSFGTSAGGLPVLISLILVFLVLVYVYPLRLMAISLAEFIGRDIHTVRTLDEIAALFTLYGIGFMAMAGAMAALFATSLRAPLSPEARAGVTGWIGIWLILASSGLLSALLARVAPIYAPWVYSLLPIATGLFSWRHKWAGESASEEPPPA
ncbi:MAG TPA: TMEM175 family protein [Allosphingosinicella sp.]|jgi:uncharacterized membrane protein